MMQTAQKRLTRLAVIAAMAAGLGPHGASAFTDQQRTWCYDDKATDPQTIEGCTALIQSGQFSGHDLAIILFNRGLSYENTKQYSLAMADFSQAVGLDPNYAEAYDDRGNVYYKSGNNAQALSDFDRAIALRPGFALAYSNRGYVHYVTGDLDQALADLDRSISLDQSQGRAFVNRAIVHAARHDCDGAVQDYMAAKRLSWNFTISDRTKAQCGSALAAAGL
jgi:lipoprotein NlpI